MATEKQILEFINRIAPISQKAYKELGKVLPSICIGMACVESAYGTAGSCKHESYLGQKVGTGKTATKYWGGKSFNSKTKEEYTVGKHTTIQSDFRAYDSLEQCVFNFYELLNTKLYAGVKSGVDYVTQMNQIKKCGYMTSSTEVNSVITIIKKYGLDKYDGKEPVKVEEFSYKNNSKYPTLSLGMSDSQLDGKYIESWQNYLATLGLFKLNPNIAGKFETTTHFAVRHYQEIKGLQVDGIIGLETWKSSPAYKE